MLNVEGLTFQTFPYFVLRSCYSCKGERLSFPYGQIASFPHGEGVVFYPTSYTCLPHRAHVLESDLAQDQVLFDEVLHPSSKGALHFSQLLAVASRLAPSTFLLPYPNWSRKGLLYSQQTSPPVDVGLVVFESLCELQIANVYLHGWILQKCLGEIDRCVDTQFCIHDLIKENDLNGHPCTPKIMIVYMNQFVLVLHASIFLCIYKNDLEVLKVAMVFPISKSNHRIERYRMIKFVQSTCIVSRQGRPHMINLNSF